MARRRGATPGPVPGACRWYQLVPADTRDAFGAAAGKMRAKGWAVHERGYTVHIQQGAWRLVTGWGTPPRSEGGTP